MRLTAFAALGLCAALAAAHPAASQARDTTSGPVLSLDEALHLAVRNNPDYLQTVASRRTASAQLRSARGALLPSVNASFGTQYQRAGAQQIQGANFNVASDIYQSNYSVGVNYRLNAASFVNPRLQSANVAATEADIVGALATLRSGVTQQYLAVLKAQAQADLQDSLVLTNTTQLALANAKLQVGSGTSLDVTRAQVDLGTQRVAALRARNQIEVEKLRLFQRVGVQQPPNVQLTSNLTITEPTFTLESLISDARRANPVLNAIRSREKVATLGVKSARSDYLPSLFVSTGLGGYTYQLADPEGQIKLAQLRAIQSQSSCFTTDSLRRGAGLPGIGSACASLPLFTDADAAAFRNTNSQFPFNFTKQPFAISAQVSIPVFNGFQRESNVQLAQAQHDDAIYAVRRGELALTEGITEFYLQLRTAARTVALQEQTVARAREELRLAEERFRVGAGTSLDVTTARASFERAETDRINAVYDFHSAFAALESAVGRPLR
ncbi:MAG: TolC family protein [Gemmatimonadaceae bacterium]